MNAASCVACELAVPTNLTQPSLLQLITASNFGKLNYYLGAGAKKDGRPSRYPHVDFCKFGLSLLLFFTGAFPHSIPSITTSLLYSTFPGKDPEVICATSEFKELKWVAGEFYWVESVQSYNEGGWDYTTELKKFVEGGMTGTSFIDGVSGIVNRGCHNPVSRPETLA